jgi:hypothetical protein
MFLAPIHTLGDSALCLTCCGGGGRGGGFGERCGGDRGSGGGSSYDKTSVECAGSGTTGQGNDGSASLYAGYMLFSLFLVVQVGAS